MKLPPLPEHRFLHAFCPSPSLGTISIYGTHPDDVKGYGRACAKKALLLAIEMLQKARDEAKSSINDQYQYRGGYFKGQYDLADKIAEAISKVEIEK